MTILETIKEDSLKARKEKDSTKASLLTTLYSEALMVGKNKRNDVPTDEETKATIKKFIKNATEVKEVSIAKGFGIEETKARNEISILEAYLPKGLSEEELCLNIARIIEVDKINNLGLIMKTLKEKYNGLYDGKRATEIVKEMLK